jgi:plasmid stabilization system protein ParE
LRRRLRFSEQALADLDEIRAWLRPRSPGGLQNVTRRLAGAVRSLVDHPDAGRPTTNPEIRELVEPRYGFILPYTVRGDTIWVLRVYSARRNPADMPASPAPERD